jgi:DNA-binding XRE family transcriptional regulator/predicted DNA-binding protein
MRRIRSSFSAPGRKSSRNLSYGLSLDNFGKSSANVDACRALTSHQGVRQCLQEVSEMNEMVTIPKEEYLRLKAIEEDLADLKSAADVLARIKTGTEELIPSAIVDRLLAGDAPLTVWREYRSLSQAELARQSGVNRIQIIDIEAGRKTGSAATLKKLATVLQVDHRGRNKPASAKLSMMFRFSAPPKTHASISAE